MVTVSPGLNVTGLDSGMNRGNQLCISCVCDSGTVDSSTLEDNVEKKVPENPCSRASVSTGKDTAA